MEGEDYSNFVQALGNKRPIFEILLMISFFLFGVSIHSHSFLSFHTSSSSFDSTNHQEINFNQDPVAKSISSLLSTLRPIKTPLPQEVIEKELRSGTYLLGTLALMIGPISFSTLIILLFAPHKS